MPPCSRQAWTIIFLCSLEEHKITATVLLQGLPLMSGLVWPHLLVVEERPHVRCLISFTKDSEIHQPLECNKMWSIPFQSRSWRTNRDQMKVRFPVEYLCTKQLLLLTMFLLNAWDHDNTECLFHFQQRIQRLTLSFIHSLKVKTKSIKRLKGRISCVFIQTRGWAIVSAANEPSKVLFTRAQYEDLSLSAELYSILST